MGLFDVNNQKNLIDLNGFRMEDPLKLILISYDSEGTYIHFYHATIVLLLWMQYEAGLDGHSSVTKTNDLLFVFTGYE